MNITWGIHAQNKDDLKQSLLKIFLGLANLIWQTLRQRKVQVRQFLNKNLTSEDTNKVLFLQSSTYDSVKIKISQMRIQKKFSNFFHN